MIKDYVVAFGNPFDGIKLFGTFEDNRDADQWAHENHDGEEWWVSEVHAIEDTWDSPTVNLWHDTMKNSAERFGILHLKAHEAIRETVHEHLDISLDSLSGREKTLVALAIACGLQVGDSH